ncbi:MAG: hypothetical protein WD749_13690 [Phycisphaerales bacterium]
MDSFALKREVEGRGLPPMGGRRNDGRPVAFNLVWTNEHTVSLGPTDGSRPPPPDVLASRGYVGRLRLIPETGRAGGARRFYFNCDRCGRLKRFLYACRPGGWFACRECHGLSA